MIEQTKTKWINKEEDLKTATVQELERTLITGDGMGYRFKTLALAELKRRFFEESVLIPRDYP